MSTYYNLSYNWTIQEKKNYKEVVKVAENLFHPILFQKTLPNNYFPIAIAESYSKSGNNLKAQYYYNLSLLDDPSNISYLNKYAKHLIKRKNFIKARDLISQSKYLHPSYIETKILDGKLLYHEKYRKAAIQKLEATRAELIEIKTAYEESGIPPEEHNWYEILTRRSFLINLHDINQFLSTTEN